MLLSDEPFRPEGAEEMRRSRAEFLRVLRNAGLFEVAEELAPVLPEIVDFERDQKLLERFGLHQDELMNRMGGSP